MDSSLPIKNLDAKINAVVLGYGRVLDFWGQSGTLSLVLPYAWISANGDVQSQPRSVERSGFGDLAMRQIRLPWTAVSSEARRLSILAFLVALVLFIVAVPFLQDLPHGDLIQSALLTLVLVSGVLAIGARRGTLVPAAKMLLGFEGIQALASGRPYRCSMVRSLPLAGRVLLLAIAVLAALPAGAQRLASYETRSILVLPEQVAELADRTYWTARLATQSQLTLIRGSESALPPPEALLAAISTWLSDTPAESSDWVFALVDPSTGVTSLGARVSLRPGVQRPELQVHPLEVDDVVDLETPEIASSDWRPARAFLHAGFPDGIEPYCDARPSLCATVFGWVDQLAARRLRVLLTVSHNGEQTTFYVERPGTDTADAGPLVRYLGEVVVTRLSPPPRFALKDGADLELEQMTSNDDAKIGQVRGVSALELRERVAVKSAILNYYQTGTRSAEVDVVLPAGPAGEAMLYTLRFLPKSNDVVVETLGPAANQLPAAGPRSDIRRIPGFPARGDGASLRVWLRKRYPGLSAKGTTRDEIVASADRVIENNSGVPKWFAVNYGMVVLGPKAANARLAEAHGRPTHLRGGLDRFNASELRTLEAVLQRLGEPALVLLRGTALVRQNAAEATSPFGDLTSRVQIAGHTFTRTRAAIENTQRPDVIATVVIYDAAHSRARFIGGRAPDGMLRVYPPAAAVFAHELGHVISRRAPAQRRFKELVTSLGVAPFTRYAASNPESEFFPEALALYLLDPAWVQDNHPELYARVQAYARRPRSDALKGQPQQFEMRESAR